MKKSKTNNFKWTLKKSLGLFVALLVIVVGGIIVYYNNAIAAISNVDEIVYFEIKEGDNISTIANNLDEQGIVKNASITKLAARFDGIDTFNVGTYVVNRSWNTPKILNYISNPENIKNDEVLITFQEGIWAKDIAKKIEENTNVSANELIALWNDETFLRQCIDTYDFLDESILNNDYRIKLEGYLYPETYYFMKETTPEDVTTTFLNHFAQEYEKIRKDVEASEMSLHEIITLASIVQYESASKEDMEMVAGVFYNRLAIGQKLESSVTVCYSLYEFDSWLDCEKSSDIDSLYNTYKYNGLPIGPILNPGKQAIEATLHPTKHDYYYFIADVQGDNTVYYAKTWEEHEKNVEKYLDY